MKISTNSPCPCGLGKKYKKCCKPFHEKIAIPKTAEELMRSRYCAYALNKALYIIETTHKENKDFTSDFKAWEDDILHFCQNTKFKALEVLEFIEGENESYVTFKASLIQVNQDASFIEKSRFLKENNKWLYVDGEFK